MIYVGVDACRGGWVAVVIDDAEGDASGVFVPRLQDLPDVVPDASGVAIDIPIGLPRSGRRRADALARQQLGARRNSVFFTPIREALVAATHREASAVSHQLTGQGISQQAYALRTKILEAELFVSSHTVPVWEVHPELSFTVLLGQPPSASKKSWAGMRERVRALDAVGIRLDDLGGAEVAAAVDDVVDAAVAAWSCRRLVNDEAVSFPDPPQQDPDTGRLVAIWA